MLDATPALRDPPALARARPRGRRGRARRSTTSSACRSTRCPTSPTSRSRSTPRRRATRRSRSSSAITFPIETAMARAAAPRVDALALALRAVAGDGRLRGRHRHLLRAPARRTSASRRCASQLPPGVEPAMGPIATGLGEIFMWTVESDARRDEARRHAVHADGSAHDPGLDHQAAAPHRARRHRGQHDRRLREAVPRHARPGEARRLRAHRSATCSRRSAKNNANVGAGYIEHNGEQYLVRAPGQVATLDEIRADRRRAAASGVPIRVRRRRRRAASARSCAPAPPPRTAEEVVLGTVFMLIGENSRAVSQRVAAKLAEVNRSAAAGRDRRRRSTTAPRSSTRTIATVRDQPGRRRAARDRRAVRSCSATCARGAHHRAGHPALDALHRHRHGREPGQRAT